jgi:hypothetical protein
MTGAADLIVELRSRGVVVLLDGDQIRCRAPQGVLTPDDAQALRALKPRVQALLVAEEAEIAWRADVMHTRANGASLPADLVVDDGPAMPGICRSCGDAMPYEQTGKCTLCCLAAGRIVREHLAKEAGV